MTNSTKNYRHSSLADSSAVADQILSARAERSKVIAALLAKMANRVASFAEGCAAQFSARIANWPARQA